MFHLCWSRIQLITVRGIATSLPKARQGNVNSFTERTHTCGQLAQTDIGKQVKLFGWVQSSRFDNKIIALKDKYGVTQCIIDRDLLPQSFKKKAITNESVVRIDGTVHARPSKQSNKNLSTGDIEVRANRLEILSHAKEQLPILYQSDLKDVAFKHETRFKYRYLNLRHFDVQRTLKFRSDVIHILRNKLHELDFIDCVTPTLCKRTPGGANEFIVPTQTEGRYYSLPQSPQLFKQLLMIGCLDRYFQFCLCYRDEAGHADRQPEFTQLDIELSFTNQELVMKMVEEILFDLGTNLSRKDATFSDLLKPFTDDKRIGRITYAKAIEKYGSDKPDVRFEWFIENCGDGSLQIMIPHEISRDKIMDCMPVHLHENNLHSLVSVESREGFTKLKITSDSFEARTLLGSLRFRIARLLDRENVHVYNSKFGLLWVVDFPLFARNKETEELEPNHHPFTAPTSGSLALLDEDPLKVLGQHYDLVLNGQEVAGGSIRIHDADLQGKILSKVLSYDANLFEFFVNALRSGCPPHGGLAFGFDRLIAILLDLDTIKEVIPFPKSNAGTDLMSGCPHEIDNQVKRMYNIPVANKS